MDKFKMLSGEELVIQGAKKVNSSLPELGLKDIIPNGSWLEQKQIQSSLEARRHIVEVERIEKCGTLSQADWNDELQLAEVKKNAGGHWQYVGHNIGRQLYLYPEEALYLMEVSCLQLKYNDVTVSIQQAYSLLLKDNNSLIRYKVYASLSRLGYKVLRHTYVKANDSENDEAEDKIEDPSSEKTCEVTDTSKENVETKSMNETTNRNGAKGITDCQMRNISNDENTDSTKNFEIIDNSVELKNNETIKVTAITGELKDRGEANTDIDQEKQQLCVKASDQIAGYQMNDDSNDENTETANRAELSSSSGQVCELTSIIEENKDNKGLDNIKEENGAKVTDKITDCHMNDISIDEKRDTNENIEAAEKVNKYFSSKHTFKVPAITEEQEKNEEINLKMEEDCGKQTDNIAVCHITNSLNLENTDNDMIEGSDKQKDHIENIKTDFKTEGCTADNKDIVQNIESSDEQSSLVDIKENSKSDDCEIICMESCYTDEIKVISSVDLCDDDFNDTKENDVEISGEIGNSSSAVIIQNKIEILTCRELKPSNSVMVDHCITENLPDFYQKQVVTVKAPDEQLIPRNVFLNNTAYVLNLENLKLKSVTPAPSSSTRTYSVSDEANEQHVRRIGGGYPESSQINFNSQFFPNMRFPQQTPQFRPYPYWHQYHWIGPSVQRPFFTSMPFRFQFLPRMQPMFRCIPSRSMMPGLENADSRRARKRKRENPKIYHLESIKKLALKLKSLVASGNRQEQNIQALQRLIDTYNVRYKARIELTAQLDIVENEIILETINLDDDDQSSSRKKKREEIESYDENFNALKQFSVKIKDLEAKKILTTRHKRAFSNVIKTFNKSYNADVYFDSNYDVIDRRRIIIASSSDSDCAVEEIQTSMEDTSKPRKSRKLRNPFYILKQLSEKQSPAKSSQDIVCESSRITLKKKFEYSDHLKKMFSKYWLPSEDDFGRAEVPLRSEIRNQIDHSEEFLYQFIKSQPVKFSNWLEAKIAYWQACKEAALKYEAQSQNESIKLDSIIKPEDCTDLHNVLNKLSIIKAATDVEEECSLSIHFDVYNRDVANFKKTKKPTPHFRVICIAESSPFPSGVEFATLHSKYDDDVVILFAIVGTSSIAYLQMNPVDLPIYLPSNNLP